VSWTYDALGRRRTMTDPDGNVTTYTYANTPSNRRLVSLVHPFSGTTSFSYDSRGRLAQVVPANCDMGTLFEYDALDRLRAVTHGECGGPSAYHREEYTYNAASMRTRIDYSREEVGIMVPDSHRLFAYDRVGRLVEEHKRRAGDNVTQYRYAYSYDPAGNRTQMVHFNGTTTVTTWYSYNAGNQLMARVQDDGPEWDYVYDANGNQVWELDAAVGQTGWWRGHNRENRLTRVERRVNGTTVSAVAYAYDAMGRLLLQTAPDGTMVRYYYDGINTLLERQRYWNDFYDGVALADAAGVHAGAGGDRPDRGRADDDGVAPPDGRADGVVGPVVLPLRHAGQCDGRTRRLGPRAVACLDGSLRHRPERRPNRPALPGLSLIYQAACSCVV
jgi:YD repeat-containing protein